MSKRTAFMVLFSVGILMVAVGYALEQYYKANIADKNRDGVKDWHDVDLNNDGRVDMQDIVLVSKYADGRSSYGLEQYDINEDGAIDRTDGELVAQFFGQSLSLININTNQGKTFITGLVVTVLSLIGIMATWKQKRRR